MYKQESLPDRGNSPSYDATIEDKPERLSSRGPHPLSRNRHIPRNVFRREILECGQVVRSGRSRKVCEKTQHDVELMLAILWETVALAGDAAFAPLATQGSYENRFHRVPFSGCASVLKITLSNCKVSGGAKSK